ncbi:helix-turn-helix transcriptional regulator [Oceanobacillus sp. FSL K6-0251]|uniref:helix-turn-helix transcriptional regulator n=1 Tax=Oceanobacillus sp. FSL K6-0251 TaxID=2921602 RepID=UPI0030F5EB98
MRKNLRVTRIEKGYKDVELFAEKLDISASYYYKIEQGIRRPNVDLAKKIADILSSTVDDLFFNQDLDVSSNKQKQIV